MSAIFQRVPALHAVLDETITHLRMAKEGCLIIAVTGEGPRAEHLRREVQAAIVEQLYAQSTFDEHNIDPVYPSLAAYLETLPPPDEGKQPITFVGGLEALTDEDKQAQAIRLLNLERDVLQNSRRSVLLWVHPETISALIHQAGDFWAWRSAVLEFQLPPGVSFQLSPPARLPAQELARLYRFKDAYERQLASDPPPTPSTADLKLQLAEIYGQLGFPERQVLELRREGLTIKAQTGDEQAQIQAYNQHVIDRYGRLTLYSLTADAPLRVELEHVYVQLTAVKRVRRPEPEVLWQAEEGWMVGNFELEKGEIRSLPPPPHIVGEATKNGTRQQTESEEAEKRKSQSVLVKRVLSVTEALAEAERTIIVGAPGSGKTTLLQWIALTFARDAAQERLGLAERRVPIFVPLRALGKYIATRPEHFQPTPACLLDFLQAHFAAWQLDLPGEFFAGLAAEGRCAFLFDGLDEVADPGRRSDVSRAVQALVARYPGNRYTVTSRPAGYTGLAHFGNDFQRCDVRPFSDDDVEQFTTNWYLAVETAVEDNPTTRQKANENAADLLQRIRANDRIRQLADTPLLLTVVALVHQNRTTLPHRRAELYDECTQMLLGFWDEQKGGQAARELAQLGELDRYDKRAILEPIALRLHEQGDAREVEGHDLRQWLREEFAAIGDPHPDKRAKLFLRVIQERAGLLVESDADTYRFSHLTFQEYLTARAIADRDDYIEYTLARRHDPWWREVILLQAGHLSTPRSKRARRLTTALIEAIWQTENDDPLEREIDQILRRNLLLAGRCLADLGPIGVDDVVRDNLIAELAQTLSATRYTKLREETAQVLFELGERDTAVLIPIRGDDGVFGRLAAVKPISALADDGWLGRLVAVASNLVQLGHTDPDVVMALISALADDEWRVRQAAASSLVQLGQSDPDVVQALIFALVDDNPYVREAAASSLGELGHTNPDVVMALISALADDEWRVREVAASSLGELGHTATVVVTALISALADDVQYVWEAAAFSLVQLGHTTPDVVTAIISALADDDSGVRQAAAFSLGQLEHTAPNVVQALISALTDDEWRVRQAAASSLGQLRHTTPAVVTALISALVDDDSYVQHTAASSLGQLGHTTPDVVIALISALANAVPYVQCAAASSLVQLVAVGTAHPAPDVVTALISALTDNNPSTRQAAASSLGQLRHTAPDVVTALISALTDTEWSVREAAASSLGQLGHTTPAVVTALISALADYDSDVRQAAFDALWAIAGGAALLQEE